MESISLKDVILNNCNHPLTSSSVDVETATRDILKLVGENDGGYGGKLTFYGKDPIVPSVIAFGANSASALAAKAIMIAKIWKDRTGEGQDIHVDLRKALRRFNPFIDGQLELLNGFPGKTDPNNPFWDLPMILETKDGRYMFPTGVFPGLRQTTLKLLNCTEDAEAIAQAVKKWNSYELEQAAEDAGVPMALCRSVEEIFKLPVFKEQLANMPLIRIEKIGDSAPKPWSKNPETPLDGIRVLGLAHVIAGASVGRALALHGADVLNVWKPNDIELETFHLTSHVGMRSTKLDIAAEHGRSKFNELLANADVFIANRRPGYLEKYGLDAHSMAKDYPGIIHTRICYASEEGAWSKKVGFDVTAGAAFGMHALEGTKEKPQHPPITVVNDYIAGWLTTVGILAALRRRAVEGGSYRVVTTLGRTVLWQLAMGIFAKEFAAKAAGSDDEHEYIMPDQFTVETPMGTYTGVTEQVEMTKTPGHYQFPLEPLGAAKPQWL